MTLPSPWRTVRSLLVMGDQLNTLWPNRSRASDGTVADAAHSSTSDHYPHHVDALGANYVVTARDVTHDPAHGADMVAMTETLRRSRDPRLKYVIFNREIFSNPAYSHASDQWAWRPYDGSDPHTSHAHVSVLDAAIADSMTPWQLSTQDTGGVSMASEWHTGEPSGPFLTQGDDGYSGQQRDTALAFTWKAAHDANANAVKVLQKLAELGAGGVRPEDVAEHIITDPRFKALLTESIEDALARARIVVDPAI